MRKRKLDEHMEKSGGLFIGKFFCADFSRKSKCAAISECLSEIQKPKN